MTTSWTIGPSAPNIAIVAVANIAVFAAADVHRARAAEERVGPVQEEADRAEQDAEHGHARVAKQHEQSVIAVMPSIMMSEMPPRLLPK